MSTTSILRRETPEDYRKAEEVTREAFWNHYAPGCDEHYLLHTMRKVEAFLPELDMVAEVDGALVGQIAYTGAKLLGDDGGTHRVLTFGPLSVLPGYQGRGIGGALIRETVRMAKALGHRAILLYGDPDYYSRFGFAAAETFGIGTGDDLYAPALQALELAPGALAGLAGRFVEDAVYHVDASASRDFDSGFAPKERRDDLPSQARFLQLLSMARPREPKA